MAKGRLETSSNDIPQLHSLKTRKRECPRDELSLIDEDTEEPNTVVSELPKFPQSPLQKSTMISAQQDQAAEDSSTKLEETNDQGTSIYLKSDTCKAIEGQVKTTVTNHSQPENFRLHTKNANGEGMEGIPTKDPHQVYLTTSEEADGSCATTLGEQKDTRESSQLEFERNQGTSQEELTDVCMGEISEVEKEGTQGVPAKKKRRMGMCGLTDKERSHFLQTNMRDIRTERAEGPICQNRADLLSSASLPASPLPVPVGSIMETREMDMQPQSMQSGAADRPEPEVHITISDVCDPHCSDGQTCEADGGLVADPKQPADLNSETSPNRVASSQSKNEETDTKRHGGVASVLQVDSVTIATEEERREETSGDAMHHDRAEAGASLSGTQQGGYNCDSVELSMVAVPSGGAKRKDDCCPDNEPGTGPSVVNTEHPHTQDSADPFGSGCSDDVSDSQLNNIVWMEDKVIMEEGRGPGSSDKAEDATDLICGLIREVSSLNRTVMAAHRELENLRRGGRSSRNAIH